jgi:hypothetical protein
MRLAAEERKGQSERFGLRASEIAALAKVNVLEGTVAIDYAASEVRGASLPQ